MKLVKIIFLVFLVLTLNIKLNAQDNAATPEYEATKQTEKLQQELNLTSGQVKQVYEINLKYARARQASTSRSEAMQRMKNKDTDLQKVLNSEQVNRLQNKRYERSNFQSVNPTNYRSIQESPNLQPAEVNNNADTRKESRRTNSQMQTTRRNYYNEENLPTRRNNSGVIDRKSTNSPVRQSTPSTQPTQQNSSSSAVSSGTERR